MRLASILRFATAVGFAVLPPLANAQATASSCLPNPEDPVRLVHERSGQDADTFVDLLDPADLERVRGRIEQMLGDRYSTASRALRETVFEAYAPVVSSMPDRELVTRFLRRHTAGREPLVDVLVTPVAAGAPRLPDLPGVEDFQSITVSYKLRRGFASSAPIEEQTFARRKNGCWRSAAPDFLWRRLSTVEANLSVGRIDHPMPRTSKASATFAVAELGSSEKRGFQKREFSMPWGPGEPLWVSTVPVISAKDVATVSAGWFCGAGAPVRRAWDAGLAIGLIPEAAARLHTWSAGRLGQRIAILVDDQVISVPYLTGPLGPTFTVCTQNFTLESAQLMAQRLTGATPAEAAR